MAADGIRAPSAAFLALLSQELREPLRVMTRWVALLAAAGHDREIVANAVRGLERALRRQAELADDLLEVSQLATGHLPMAWTTFDLAPVLRAGVARLHDVAAQNHVGLSLDAPAEPLPIAGDERRIRQAIDTLLDNALAGAVPGRSVSVHVATVDGRCEIEIDEDAAPIDQPGPGTAGALPDGEPGALKLLLVRHLIEAHGGVMRIPAHGPGALFHVELPRARDDDPLRRGARGARLLEGLHILVVDDDETSREALAEALTHFGGRPALAPSAATALERLRGERFDAVCSDIEMPGDSGLVLARRLRADERDGHRQPLIAVSGLVGDEHAAAARQAGFDAYLAKPVDVERLARRLRALVDAARAAQLERNSPTVANDGT